MSAASGALRALSGHTLVYLAGSLCAKLASILLLPIFTRPEYLSPSDYGTLSLLNSTLAFLLQLVGFQLDAAMTRHYFDAPDDRGRRRVVSTAFFALLGLALVTALPLALASRWLADHWLERSDLPHAIAVLAAILVAMVLTEVPLAALKAERRSMAVTGWLLLRLLGEIGLKILFVVGFGLGVFGVVAGQAVAAAVFLVGFTSWLLVRFGGGIDLGVLRAMVAFSAPMVVAGLCQFVLHNGDRFVLKELSTDHQLGLYDVGYQFGYAVNAVVLSAFLLIWYPFIFSVQDRAEQRGVVGAAALHVPAFILLASLPVALLAPEIVELLTSDPAFHGAWVFVPVILTSYLFWGLFQVLQTPFYIHKRTGALPRIVATAAAANLLLNLALIPLVGALGAAFSTLLALALLAGLTHRAARQLDPEPVPVPWRRMAGLAWIVAACGAALYLVPRGAHWWLPVRLLVLVLCCAWLMGPFLTRDERTHIFATLRSLPLKLRARA